MRVFKTWEEVKEAYGFVDSDPIPSLGGHVFLWCELCEEVHCDYCAQTDDTEGVDDPCSKRLARLPK